MIHIPKDTNCINVVVKVLKGIKSIVNDLADKPSVHLAVVKGTKQFVYS
jgi:hypothetical protein